MAHELLDAQFWIAWCAIFFFFVYLSIMFEHLVGGKWTSCGVVLSRFLSPVCFPTPDFFLLALVGSSRHDVYTHPGRSITARASFGRAQLLVLAVPAPLLVTQHAGRKWRCLPSYGASGPRPLIGGKEPLKQHVQQGKIIPLMDGVLAGWCVWRPFLFTLCIPIDPWVGHF